MINGLNQTPGDYGKFSREHFQIIETRTETQGWTEKWHTSHSCAFIPLRNGTREDSNICLLLVLGIMLKLGGT